jgi:hypothetical protein
MKLENRGVNFDFEFRKPKPGLPIFGTVSAATPIPSETLPSIQSSLALPEKPGQIIPQKPGQMIPAPSRVSEIMRFGFPGMANVRARK